MLSPQTSLAAKPSDAAAVLVIVNDGAPPEEGTGGLGASVFVGLHYANVRQIPADNILHINIPGADPHAPASWRISQDDFENKIRTPFKRFIKTHGRFKYVVPTYGVPTHFAWAGQGYYLDESVDSWLSTTLLPPSGSDTLLLANPLYNSDPNSLPAHWQSANDLRKQIYVVSRLDGPSALLAAALVDRAITAERGISRHSGLGYFDWQHRSDPGGAASPAWGYFTADQTVWNAYQLCAQARLDCSLNDQSQTGSTLQSAPGALWAWGWYQVPTHTGYSFTQGAVGAQMTSYTANTLRSLGYGSWVPLWVTQGITATWGAVAEPYTTWYAKGDNLLAHMWHGYSFGEAAYLAQPALNHVMVFVGDPLYTLNLVD